MHKIANVRWTRKTRKGPFTRDTNDRNERLERGSNSAGRIDRTRFDWNTLGEASICQRVTLSRRTEL